MVYPMGYQKNDCDLVLHLNREFPYLTVITPIALLPKSHSLSYKDLKTLNKDEVS